MQLIVHSCLYAFQEKKYLLNIFPSHANCEPNNANSGKLPQLIIEVTMQINR